MKLRLDDDEAVTVTERATTVLGTGTRRPGGGGGGPVLRSESESDDSVRASASHCVGLTGRAGPGGPGALPSDPESAAGGLSRSDGTAG
jgi:hypothetical protein